jgi:hypothetical protein
LNGLAEITKENAMIAISDCFSGPLWSSVKRNRSPIVTAAVPHVKARLAAR